MHIDKYERYWIMAFTAVLAVFVAALVAGAIVFGVRVPEEGGFINPSRLENTEFANPGIRDMGNNEYEVYMVAQKWAFIPREISVPLGATVTFHITSRDITHGFIIEHHNANIELVPGHVGQTTVTFDEEGTFAYLCHEYCGQFHHGMWGQITVGEATVETARSN